MHLVGAKLKNFYNFTNRNEGEGLEACEVQVKIPHYQRPYEWDKQNVSLLINDALNNVSGKYFSGASVSSIHNEYCHELVDGQQRYTTLFLINYCVFLISRVALRESLLCGAFVHANFLAKELEKSMRYVFILKKDSSNSKAEIIDLNKEIDKLMDLDEPDFDRIATLKKQINKLKNNNVSADDLSFKSVFGKRYADLISAIEESGNSKTKIEYDDVIKKFYSLKILSDLHQEDVSYTSRNRELIQYFFTNANFRITYARKKYTDLIEEALLSVDFNLSSQNHLALVDSDEKVELTYKNALETIFNEVSERVTDNNPLDNSVSIIKTLTKILESLDICVVQTGSQSDATVLFDVLNDRSKELSQLSLIKNEFYKRVVICHDRKNDKTPADDQEIDQCIDEIDRVWVDEIFNASMSDAALVSYLGACFLSASTNTNYSINGKETRTAISEYLKKQKNYSIKDLGFDIGIFHAIKIILQELDVKYQKVADVSLTAEANNKSIFERTVKLLLAKKQEGILSGLINFILWKIISKSEGKDRVDINKLKSTLKGILNSHYEDVNNQCLEIWVSSLSSKDYALPRALSKQLIQTYNKSNLIDENINQPELCVRSPKSRHELISWLSDWKYKSSNQFEVKVLLINLMSRDPSKNIKLSDKKPQFFSGFTNASCCHLDHFEPKSLPEGNQSSYFQSESRDDLVNSLGNMMLLTQVDNQRKSDAPASKANDHYAKSDIGDNWLYKRLYDMYVNHSKHGVPTEAFFTERKKDLIMLIADLLHS